MKESKKVECSVSHEKPLPAGGFDRFTAGQIYDPADYDYPLGKPNFKPYKENKKKTTPRGSGEPETTGLKGEVRL
ncbi:MAG TPA: hypothetical protein ENH40_01790 [Nitrospirae bacterium]|nr:hypothetical protein [Nitrospirota bacterium]